MVGSMKLKKVGNLVILKNKIDMNKVVPLDLIYSVKGKQYLFAGEDSLKNEKRMTKLTPKIEETIVQERKKAYHRLKA